MLPFRLWQGLDGCDKGVIVRSSGILGMLGVDTSLEAGHLSFPLFAGWLDPKFSSRAFHKHPLGFPVQNLIGHTGQQRLVRLRRKVIPALVLLFDIVTVEEMVDSGLTVRVKSVPQN